jgi:C4-dicarboxylate transporter DctQ subunit
VDMKLLAKAIKIYDRIIDISVILAGILVIFLMLSVSLEVALRYFFGHPTSWVVEIAGYILLFIPFLVAAWVLKREGHVRMDLVLNRLSPMAQSVVNAITSFVSAIVCFILTWFGVKATVYYIGYQTPTVLMMPKSLLIAIIFVGMFLLFVQLLRMTYGYLAGWGLPPEKKEGPMKNPEREL